MKTTTCKACGKPIVWIRTTKGKSMPCDAEPVAYKEIKGGKEKIVTSNGEVISCTFDAKPEEMAQALDISRTGVPARGRTVSEKDEREG